MISNELFQELKIGQEVYIITGPGEFAEDGMCSMQGPIIEKLETQFGFFVLIKVEKSLFDELIENTEQVNHISKVGEKHGIGAYIK